MFFDITMLVGIIISTIVHECGHLVFGLLTGYEFDHMMLFYFFRIHKENGRLRISITQPSGYHIGECAMHLKPGIKEEEFRFVLFWLGGIILNLICAGSLYTVKMIFEIKSAYLTTIITYNWAVAILCFIPWLGINTRSDGATLVRALSSKVAKRGFFVSYALPNELATGKQMRDFDDKIFNVPASANINNMNIATLVYHESKRLFDIGEYDKSYAQLCRLNTNKLTPIVRQLVKNKILFYNTVFRHDYIKARELFGDQDIQAFVASYPTSVATNRFLSAYEYFVNGDREKGENLLRYAQREITNQISIYGETGYYKSETEYCSALEAMYNQQTDRFEHVAASLT